MTIYTECVACSGQLAVGIELKDSIQQVCSVCGGIHTTVTVERYDKIAKGMRLLIHGDFENSKYFDIQAVDAYGKVIKRTHGWMNPDLGYSGIIQFG